MSRVQRWLLPVLGLIVVIVVGVTIALGIVYANAAAQERARDSALSAAQTYVVDMFSWNSKTVDAHINTTMGRLTGGAQKDYQKHIVESKVAEGVKQEGVSTVVTVQDSGVMENTRDTAKVLLFINQSSTRNNAEDVQVDKSRLIFGMEKQGDDWKINEIDILTDDSLQKNVQSGGETPPSNAVPIPSAPSSPAPQSTPAG
ncbi:MULTISPECIES: hypothetical protein [Gordonia]|uniref:Mce-associated membrane protein n=2 Tax=Gordonia TaxID=2053 RepID=L7LGD0_9ACTN|nr:MULTISPECIES: hypothetical protein [Gordonia]AUH67102.1 hypothetical protein CXX93_00370 [Gordonia sp. YC-JH1]KXT58532.1 hypothetical protein Y710_03140 [Gordonia sp. QH-12]MBY4569144.1 hypothetical protein [Gordonia sihwensis]WFN93255.1 hypothetical protein P5P27_01360 [Gordonia sihwensis]GAC59108.1 hypothetical protein GSI01S_01_00710 [Gordonia sihwensis NBRC 108236]